MKNRFPPPSLLKELAEILQEWDNISLEMIHKFCEYIPRRIAGVLKTNGDPASY